MRDEFQRLTQPSDHRKSATALPACLSLRIERLVHGGYGLARTQHGAVLVTDMLPGEEAEVDVVGKRSGTPLCAPRAITLTSPARREPFCPYAGRCGGCDWQHITYDEQVRLKKEIFIDCLTRIGRIEPSFALDTIPSPETRYRRRAQIKVDVERGAMGFFRRKSNQVIRIDSCPLLIEDLDGLLERQDDILPRLATGTAQLMAIAGSDGRVASSPAVPDHTETTTEVLVGSTRFAVGGDDFFQSNVPLLESLTSWIGSRIRGEHFLDIYGGTGLFSIALHMHFRSGTLIEAVESLVTKAQETFAHNGVGNVRALHMPAERYFAASKKLSAPDCILVDPPRPGLTRKVREGINALAPQSVVYVSCNPATQARDVGFLVNSCGYRITEGALFDLYPQTHHIESVLLLERTLG